MCKETERNNKVTDVMEDVFCCGLTLAGDEDDDDHDNDDDDPHIKR